MHSSRRSLLAFLFLAALCSGSAQERGNPFRDALELWRTEGRIERKIVLGTVRGYLSRKPPKPDWSPRTHEQGELIRDPSGTPILVLRGSPRDMGRQHGTLLRNEIQGLMRYVQQFVGPREMPKARVRAAELFEDSLPAAFREELKGLAEGAKIDYAELLLAQSFTDLYRGFGCTCVAAPLGASGTVLARNLDFPGFGYLERYSLVVVRQPANGRRTVSVGWPGLIGVLSGQSRELALAVMVVHDPDGAQPGLPFQLVFRRVLEEASTVAEAHALLREYPRTVTNNLMVVGKDGGAASFELGRKDVVRRDPPTHRWLVSTNHFLSEELGRPRASITFLNSRSRLKSARSCRPEAGAYQLADVQKALRDAEVSATLQSMVFMPQTGDVYVSLPRKAPAARGELVQLKRTTLWGDN